jgi:2-keto-4-pentenoate hydratase
MLSHATVLDAARALFAEYQGGQSFTALPGPWNINTIAEAYAVQKEYLKLLAEEQGEIEGYKLAYTTAAMQQQAGWTEPCAGALMATTIYSSPATLQSYAYRRLGFECEVAVRLAADLPASGAPYTRDLVAEAVGEVMAAFEVIDMRLPEGVHGLVRTLTSVATNISNAGAILGPPVSDWRKPDLAAARGIATVNGEEVGSGYGSDVMGHPFEPLAWLANKLAAEGEGLAAGTVVITGSIVPPKFLSAGDRAVVSIDGLGEAMLTVE